MRPSQRLRFGRLNTPNLGGGEERDIRLELKLWPMLVLLVPECG